MATAPSDVLAGSPMATLIRMQESLDELRRQIKHLRSPLGAGVRAALAKEIPNLSRQLSGLFHIVVRADDAKEAVHVRLV